MCVCVCVCVCECTRICVYVRVRVRACAQVLVKTHAHTRTQTCTHESALSKGQSHGPSIPYGHPKHKNGESKTTTNDSTNDLEVTRRVAESDSIKTRQECDQLIPSTQEKSVIN